MNGILFLNRFDAKIVVPAHDMEHCVEFLQQIELQAVHIGPSRLKIPLPTTQQLALIRLAGIQIHPMMTD